MLVGTYQKNVGRVDQILKIESQKSIYSLVNLLVLYGLVVVFKDPMYF